MKTSKTAFVLSLPENLSAAEIIARANAEGFTLTDRYVYSIRSKAKTRANAGATPKKRGRPAGSTNKPVADAREAQFVDLAINLGLQRSQALIGQLRALAA